MSTHTEIIEMTSAYLSHTIKPMTELWKKVEDSLMYTLIFNTLIDLEGDEAKAMIDRMRDEGMMLVDRILGFNDQTKTRIEEAIER